MIKKSQKKLKFSTIVFLFISIVISFSFASSKQNNDYDTIIIYRLKHEKRSHRSNAYSLKDKVVHGNIRSEDIKEGFEKNLRKFGYVKATHDKSKYDQICNKVNSFTSGKSRYEASCLHTFRDIFIYKKQDNIVKVIKICTSCYANEVITPESISELLMDFKDYDNLKELIEE